MGYEQTLAGCEQSVKKSRIGKGGIHFSFERKEDWMIGKDSNFKFSVQIPKVKYLCYKNRSCTMKKEERQEYIL